MTVHNARRAFLKKASLAAGAMLLSACAPQATPQAAAPTTAPQATEPPDAPEPTQPPVAEPTQAPTEAAPPAAEPVTFTALFHFLYPNWDERAKPYLDEHPEVTIVTVDTQSDDEFVQKITTMVAGGTPPDIAKVTGGRLIATADKGIYEDLRPRVDVSPVMSAVWPQLPDDGKEHRICGQQVGIPFDMDSRLWFVNLDLFEEVGIDPPSLDWTWDDMVAIGQAVTDKEANRWFAALPIVSFQDWSDWVWQAGGMVFSPDYDHVNLSEPESIQAGQFLVDLFNKYNVSPSPALGLGDIGITFETGKMAMHPGNAGNLSGQLGEDATWAFNWTAVFAPEGPGGAWGFVKSNAWSVLREGPQKEAGWKFLEWWMGDEGTNHMAGMGDLVARADVRNKVTLATIPDHLKPAVERWATFGRAPERSPGWSLAQSAWKAEIETSVTGGVPVEQALQAADDKAEADMAELMNGLCERL